MDKIVAEGVRRLEILKSQGLMTDIDVVKMYENDELCVSEANSVFGEVCGVIIPVKNKPKYKGVMEDGELSLYGTPYFAIAQNTSFGLMLSVLYISSDESQWPCEREYLSEKAPYAYVYNFDEDFGEIGSIYYDMFNGGPIRVG